MTTSERLSVLNGGASPEEREERLSAGADELADGRGGSSLLRNERLLLIVASGLMSFGVCVILLGWFGAAHSTLVEEQLPYLISGGVLGLAFALIGAVTFFAHWLTVMIREARVHEAARRQDHQELMEALRTLTLVPNPEDNANGRARGARPERPLRRAPRSS